MDRCKFLLFSDIHVVPDAFYDPSGRKLDIVIEAARREGVDFMIHAGDFCHGVDSDARAREAVERYNACGIPAYHSLGNHDTDNSSLAATLAAYNMPAPYYLFECHGIRFIVMSTNYCNVDGRWVPYEFGNYFRHGGSRGYVPREELEWLRARLEESRCPCVIISHMSFERLDGALNADEVRAVIDAANARRKGTVLMCINGHYHTDHMRLLNNVCYLDMNASSYYWIDEPHDRYPSELTGRYSAMRNTLVYDAPPYAVVSVSDDMEIDVRGHSSSMFMGVTWFDVSDHPYDKAGRTATATVGSAHFRLL